jgi:hypothetical protein
MEEPSQKRSWWRKKRWWAAAAVWLVVAYPLSAPPVAYAVGRGWLPWSTGRLYPPPVVSPQLTGITPPFGSWGFRWFMLGREHADAD